MRKAGAHANQEALIRTTLTETMCARVKSRLKNFKLIFIVNIHMKLTVGSAVSKLMRL